MFRVTVKFEHIDDNYKITRSGETQYSFPHEDVTWKELFPVFLAALKLEGYSFNSDTQEILDDFCE